MIKAEELLHHQVCAYLRAQYPKVLFRTDMGGVRLSMRQAINARKTQAGRAWPDLFIAHMKSDKSFDWEYGGLFLELKADGTKLYIKDGKTMVANAHYREQEEVLKSLRERGYAAHFAVGFDAAKRIIDDYLND